MQNGLKEVLFRISEGSGSCDMLRLARQRCRAILDFARPTFRPEMAQEYVPEVAITRRDADAEKVLHEVFARIVDKGVSLKRDVAFRTWVYAITTDTSLNTRRRSCRHVATSLDELLPRHTADGHREGSRDYLVADWSGMPDRRLLEGKAREVLEEAICRLPDVYRAMLVLRDVEELSNEEVAEVVGCTALEAKKQLHQARMAVREYLTQRFGAHGSD